MTREEVPRTDADGRRSRLTRWADGLPLQLRQAARLVCDTLWLDDPHFAARCMHDDALSGIASIDWTETQAFADEQDHAAITESVRYQLRLLKEALALQRAALNQAADTDQEVTR